jgi:hypothetical protein
MEILGIMLSSLLAVFLLLQRLLALGVPLGEYAWGGQNGKILPIKWRIASVVSSFFFLFSIHMVLSKTGVVAEVNPTFVNGFMWFLTMYLGLGIIMNAFSRSKKERIWAPVLTVMCVISLLITIH